MYNVTKQSITDTIEMLYHHENITRSEYLNIKAILSDDNFNNLSVRMINNILGPGYEPGPEMKVVWTF